MAEPPVENDSPIQSIEGIYEAIGHGSSHTSAAALLVALRHWFHELAEFDRGTGEALPRSMTAVLERLRKLRIEAPHVYHKDRLHRILEHCNEPIFELTRRLIERLVRERAMLPLRAVRELDTGSFMALSRRPGRTVREKLAGKPYMQAIRRRGTYDTTENRLLKSVAARLAELLSLRNECFGSGESPQNTELLYAIESWLTTEEASEISRWDNHAPNNALLQHRNYRPIWDAWMWVQSIDQDIDLDWRKRDHHFSMVLFWTVVSELREGYGVRFAEQPCYFSYDNFELLPGLTPAEPMAVANGYWVPPLASDRYQGKVVGIVDNSFGFAQTDEKRVFFHSNDFRNYRVFENLQEGAILEFSIEKTNKGWNARNVVIGDCAQEVKVKLDHDLNLHFTFGAQKIAARTSILESDKLGVSFGRETVSTLEVPRSPLEIASRLVAQAVPSRTDVFPETSNVVIDQARSTDHGVVDFTTLYPRFAAGHGHGVMPFRLLWQLWRQSGKSPVEIALPHSNAISLTEDAITVSILNLLGQEDNNSIDASILSQASKSYAAQVGQFLGTDSVTYLVPDSVDDFSLEILRKSLNFQFSKAEPLPRSIAAVFAWQSSKSFLQTEIAEGDSVWVVDDTGSGLSIVPLIAVYKNELEAVLPQTRGIYWERCPVIHLSTGGSPTTASVDVLKQHECPFSSELAALCGPQGLSDEAGNLSILGKDGDWFTIPPEAEGELAVAFNPGRECWHENAQRLEQPVRELRKGATVFLLPVGNESLRKSLGNPPHSIFGGHRSAWISDFDTLPNGGIILHQWQSRAGDIALWRDRLPELSVRIHHLKKAREVKFFLVKDATITPRLGRAIRIPIQETFYLPPGEEFYEFPLYRGEEGNQLQYLALLKSRAFPLKESVPCKLEMTFTYGDDKPYRLRFIPVDSQAAGFSSINVRWEPTSTKDNDSLGWPPFPPRHQWSELRSFSNGEGSSRNLLIEIQRIVSVKKALNELDKYESSSQSEFPPRSDGEIKDSVGMEPWEKGFCFLKTSGEDIFCHISDLCEPVDTKDLKVGTTLFFDLERGQDGRFAAKNVSVSEEEPPELDRARLHEPIEAAIRAAEDARRIRFAVLTSWSHGHSLDESEAPGELRDFIEIAKNQCLDLIKRTATLPATDPLKVSFDEAADSAFYFLCALHRDAPDETYQMIGKMTGSLVMRHWRRIAYAIGDARESFQRQLFERAIGESEKGEPVWLQILGIAVWREEGVVELISPRQARAISEQLLIVLKSELSRVIRIDRETGDEFLSPYVISKLELCLGLLRTRQSEDKDKKTIFDPDDRLSREFSEVISEIDQKINKAKVPFRSRLSLKLAKPEALRKTPDLLYALRLYLTGDSGARAIQVSGIDEDE